jgi:membrane-associated protein
MQQFIEFLLHIDDALRELVREYGTYTYLILFLVIFAETGLVFMPFLPGDSLLFAAGALAAQPDGGLNVWVLAWLLFAAAVIGDTLNYHLGQIFGARLPFIKPKHLQKTSEYFVKYGGKTIILARFVPIVRTMAPFVAGMGAMNYAQFIVYNLIGGAAWVLICVFAGYWFGNFEVVQKNFELVVVAIVLISVAPMAWEWQQHRRMAKKEREAAAKAAAEPPTAS